MPHVALVKPSDMRLPQQRNPLVDAFCLKPAISNTHHETPVTFSEHGGESTLYAKKEQSVVIAGGIGQAGKSV
jgi:hypothetical protein